MADTTNARRSGWLAESVLAGIVVISLVAANLPGLRGPGLDAPDSADPVTGNVSVTEPLAAPASVAGSSVTDATDTPAAPEIDPNAIPEIDTSDPSVAASLDEGLVRTQQQTTGDEDTVVVPIGDGDSAEGDAAEIAGSGETDVPETSEVVAEQDVNTTTLVEPDIGVAEVQEGADVSAAEDALGEAAPGTAVEAEPGGSENDTETTAVDAPEAGAEASVAENAAVGEDEAELAVEPTSIEPTVTENAVQQDEPAVAELPAAPVVPDAPEGRDVAEEDLETPTQGEDMLALAAPDGPSAPESEAGPDASIAAPEAKIPPAAPAPDAPRFDLVRVDADGTAVLAGRAAPGAMVSVLLSGKKVTSALVGDDGKFAALFLVAPSVAPQQVALMAVGQDGAELRGAETLIIAPSPDLPDAPAVPEATTGTVAAQTEAPVERAPAVQPRLLLADRDGMRVVQPGTGRPAVQTSVSIDAIAYDVEGTVVLSGRGAGTVRIYLDNRVVETVPVAADGQWRTPLPVVDTGVYQLRVDELDASGAVTSRTVTPFQREDAARIVALAEEQEVDTSGPRLITVQPGSTLWGIAREEYGRGVLFVRVFEANRGEISDPHWIYPGQIFSVPEGGE